MLTLWALNLLLAGGSAPATLPLPFAALISLTITYKLDRASERALHLIGPAMNSLAAGCPWPCMPILASLWAQKVKRWSDFLVFSASQTVFHHNSDAVVQLLKSCFTSTLGLSSSRAYSNGSVGAPPWSWLWFPFVWWDFSCCPRNSLLACAPVCQRCNVPDRRGALSSNVFC